MALLTGMGAVTPLGVGVQAFASGLRHGRSGTRLIPWRDPRVVSRVAATCPDFDPTTAMTPADVGRLPKLIPLALTAAREACAQAGLSASPTGSPGEPHLAPHIDPREVGVILGTGAGGIDFTLDQADAGHNGRRISLWTITNATHGNLAGELSIRLGAKGPSLCVSTGCASASDAVGLAKDLLNSDRPGAPRIMIVIGADAHVRWETLAGMELLGVISTRGAETDDAAAMASRPFCKSRDGFILAEGAWAVVLERDDARQRAAIESRERRVIARVRGYGVTCDAFHRVRPDPDMTESIHAMRLAMQDAAIEPTDIGVVHYHGTATQLNDVLETRAVRGALGPHAAHVPGHSVKSMIGHPQGASGLASLVSTLAGLTGADGGSPFLLPTINIQEPDPACDLDYTAGAARPADAARHKIALINCLAFGAKNSALVVEVA